MSMRRCILFLCALASPLLGGACRKAPPPEPVSWTDPVNDVLPFPDEASWVQPDIVLAKAWGKEDSLHLEIEMPFSIEDYYAQTGETGLRRGQLVAAFFIDADNDPKSGFFPLQRPERSGYEFAVDLNLGFWAKSKETGLVRRGRVTFDPRTYVYKRIPTFELLRLHADYREEVRPGVHVGIKSFDDLTQVQGNRMSVAVPYKLLGVKSGDSIRVCYHEASAGPEAAAYSNDQTVVLE